MATVTNIPLSICITTEFKYSHSDSALFHPKFVFWVRCPTDQTAAGRGDAEAFSSFVLAQRKQNIFKNTQEFAEVTNLKPEPI